MFPSRPRTCRSRPCARVPLALLFLLLIAACGDGPASPEPAVRQVIAQVQSQDWPRFEAMALNQADFIALSLVSTGDLGSNPDGVLRTQERNRLHQEFDRTVASRALLGTDPSEFIIEARMNVDELWIVDVLLPDGRSTGIKMALRWWKNGYKVTRMQAPY